MLATRILPHHSRRHETAATAHVHNHAPTPPLANRFNGLLHHGRGLRTCAEEHAKHVHVHEALEIGDGSGLYGDGGTDTNLHDRTEKGRGLVGWM